MEPFTIPFISILSHISTDSLSTEPCTIIDMFQSESSCGSSFPSMYTLLLTMLRFFPK